MRDRIRVEWKDGCEDGDPAVAGVEPGGDLQAGVGGALHLRPVDCAAARRGESVGRAKLQPEGGAAGERRAWLVRSLQRCNFSTLRLRCRDALLVTLGSVHLVHSILSFL